MHQVFLDANTYLGFYSLTPADITELGKLVDLIKLNKINLLLPSHVTVEVRRNRAKVVNERLKPLREARLQVAIPLMAEKTPAADSLREAAANTQRAHTKLLSELTIATQQKILPADLLIANLFAQGPTVHVLGAVEAAQQRKTLGNPPGKGSSIGDGVNWETLLVFGTQSEDLHFVSADGDFASALDPNVLDEFLANEWAEAKRADVKFYRDIKSFLNKLFPQIHLSSDVRKYFLIDALVSSTSFATSHATAAELDQYGAFNIDEATRLLSGGLENSQVRWLAQDEDIKQLVKKVIDPHRAALPKQLVDRWDFLLTGRGYSYGPVPSDGDLTAPPAVDLA